MSLQDNDKFLSALDRMIERADCGPSGFFADYDDVCINPSTFPWYGYNESRRMVTSGSKSSAFSCRKAENPISLVLCRDCGCLMAKPTGAMASSESPARTATMSW